MYRMLFSVSLALALAAPAPAQDDEASFDVEFGGLVEVSEVLLDVLATDGDGQVVAGLGRDDFIVEEDGEPVALTGVSYYSTRYGAGEPAAGEVPSSRHFIFFFHNQWQTSYYRGDLLRQQMRAGVESRRWLDEEMLPSDWVAVVSYGGAGLRVHQDFTQDREALERAFKEGALGKKPAGMRRRSPGARDLEVFRRLPRGDELRERAGNVYDALALVAEACGYVIGRKNLLMFTIGFGEERRFGEAEPDPELYPRLETALNDHNVAVYPIDTSPAGRGTRQTDFMTRLAEDTGGTYFEDFVGFIRPLRDVGGDNYAYYVLSYQSQHPAGEIGYQRVEVRARDENVQVRTRKGYRYGL
jgi:VWFA-related protein